jgi:hypothetical protein
METAQAIAKATCYELTCQILHLHQSHPNTFVMGQSDLSYLCQMFQHTNHQCHACHIEARTAKIC